MKKFLKPSADRSGFSLIELLMALAILGLVTAAGYAALRTGLTRLEGLTGRSTQSGDETIALALLAKDLRCAVLSEDDTVTHFAGLSDRLFLTRTMGEDNKIEEVIYLNEQGLVRRARRRESPLCKTGTEFKLSYFDGQAWRDRWGWNEESNRPLRGIRGLPILVKVELNETTATLPVMTPLLNGPL